MKEEAFQWNEKSGNLCWVITRYHQAAILDAQKRQEVKKEPVIDSIV